MTQTKGQFFPTKMKHFKGQLSTTGMAQVKGQFSLFLLCSFIIIASCSYGVQAVQTLSSPSNITSRVTCGIDEMQVDIDGSSGLLTGAHVQGLKEYPDGSCQAESVGLSPDLLRFRFSFSEYYRCGTTQIRNKLTGTRTFYNRIVLELTGGGEEQVLVKCQRGNQYAALLDTNQLSNVKVNGSRVKRDVLPAGFKEDPNLIPITEQIGKAPEPMLTMVVKKDGQRIGPRLIVEPGAPLTLEVSLDPISKDIYGILLSQLDVTDTGTKSEVLFHNGCSVDSFLFENFVTTDGDVLTARFKAFKFPDTNYVLFRGTINVCLNSCQGIQCITGQTGFGRRRRRDTADMNYDYEIHTAAILQVAASNTSSVSEKSPSAILDSSYTPRLATNAKQTQTAQYAIPKVAQESLANENSSSGGGRGVRILDAVSWFWILIASTLFRINQFFLTN